MTNNEQLMKSVERARITRDRYLARSAGDWARDGYSLDMANRAVAGAERDLATALETWIEYMQAEYTRTGQLPA